MNFEMNINLFTIIVAITGSFIGGWAGSFFQFKKWKRSEKFNFMWNFRLKILEAEKLMWDSKTYAELNASLNWLVAASQDPRLNISVHFAEDFSKSVSDGWRDLVSEDRYPSDVRGISTHLTNKVRESKEALDQVVLARIRKLRID